MQNPFASSNTVTGESFCNRREELSRLLNYIKGSQNILQKYSQKHKLVVAFDEFQEAAHQGNYRKKWEIYNSGCRFQKVAAKNLTRLIFAQT